MMELLQKYKTLLIASALIIVAFVVYSMFFGGTSTTTLLTSQKPAVGSGGTQLPVLLVNLKSIKLDNTLFTEQAFQSLIDSGQELIPEPAGRKNPFAPISSQ